MPITTLVNPVFISTTGAGRVNSGGTVGVYEADGLFTTLATIYSDQVKTTELTNPVTLDDAGTKEIWYEVKVDIREKTKAGAIIRDTLNLDPNSGNAVAQGFNLAQNGSFEVDELSDGQPDSWTISPYSGSAIAITSTVVTDGTKALEFNTGAAGSGGGVATSAKFPVTEGSVVSVSFSFYATHVSTTNTFQIKWYDEANVLKSTTTVTMPTSGSVPTSWTKYQEVVTVDAAGTQGEIVLTGISSGGSNLSSKAYFDGIEIVSREDDLVTLTKTQVITDKTLTSPVINTAVSGDAGVSRLLQTSKVATTSGTTADITGIPSWVKKITLSLAQVSTNGTSSYLVQIGDSGGIETSSYQSAVATVNTLSGGRSDASTAGFIITTVFLDTTFQTGLITLVLHDSSANTWVESGNINENAASLGLSAGIKSLSGVLDRVRLTTVSGDTFDSGSILVTYEG